MDKDIDIANSDDFTRLVRLRKRVTRSLVFGLLLVFAGNIYLMSFGIEIGAAPISRDSVITYAMVYSVFLVFSGAAAAIFYAWWANSHLDQISDKIKANFDPEFSKRGQQ